MVVPGVGPLCWVGVLIRGFAWTIAVALSLYCTVGSG